MADFPERADPSSRGEKKKKKRGGSLVFSSGVSEGILVRNSRASQNKR